MILLIDNYDSFTYNLAHLFGELGAEVTVIRNDAIDADGAAKLAPSHLVISPGPGRPEDAGNSIAIVERLAPTTPTLGVCLGHQAIVQAFGGEVGAAKRLMHGKASPVQHDGKGIFAGLPQDFEAGRYHSLAALSVPDVDHAYREAVARGASGLAEPRDLTDEHGRLRIADPGPRNVHARSQMRSGLLALALLAAFPAAGSTQTFARLHARLVDATTQAPVVQQQPAVLPTAIPVQQAPIQQAPVQTAPTAPAVQSVPAAPTVPAAPAATAPSSGGVPGVQPSP